MLKAELKKWILRADKDFEEAEFLFKHNRPLEHIAFFLHQAVEKYLKSFFINNDWKLDKTHDLVKLINNAINIDKSFDEFLPFMESITDYYIESRYPIGYLVEYTKEEIQESLEKAIVFIKFIKYKLSI